MKTPFTRYTSILGIALLSLFSCVIHAQKSSKIRLFSKSENNAQLASPSAITTAKHEGLKVELPEVNREFRGAWIATVANINWPSSRNLSTEQQKKEALRLLDLLKDTNFNAVIFQVRPSADALYESKYEPWSYFLSGETGKSPTPYYDPLAFWVEEAHKRGLELHVWLNPYRAHHLSGGSVHSESMVRKAPDHILRLKNGMYWFDPASKKTQDHVSNVVKDLVSRYDIDAVHFDDYFYPYASYNGGADFPDNTSWNQYQKSGGSLSRADWRRNHVNQFIERIYKEIKAEKSYVKFGISPFGIWKSGIPEGVVGSSQYDELYADAKLWLNKGWIDYFSPQLYWPTNAPRQNFEDLLEWWESENTMNRHLWPGLNTVEIKAFNKSEEIVKQVKITHQVLNENSIGAVHWSIAGLTKNNEMVHALKNGPYKEQALIPKSPWMEAEQLAQPELQITKDNGEIIANWNESLNTKAFQWVLYMRYGNNWTTEILPYDVRTKKLSPQKEGKPLQAVALKAIDRLGNESDYTAQKVENPF
ncbi:MAG TPA: family 10 glycosylhydrolase [Flavobacterium sp.]|nr:family 10 glycosylhydrolase [Flavobacterium sp.]